VVKQNKTSKKGLENQEGRWVGDDVFMIPRVVVDDDDDDGMMASLVFVLSYATTDKARCSGMGRLYLLSSAENLMVAVEGKLRVEYKVDVLSFRAKQTICRYHARIFRAAWFKRWFKLTPHARYHAQPFPFRVAWFQAMV
jgi:hypothetical protein